MWLDVEPLFCFYSIYLNQIKQKAQAKMINRQVLTFSSMVPKVILDIVWYMVQLCNCTLTWLCSRLKMAAELFDKPCVPCVCVLQYAVRWYRGVSGCCLTGEQSTTQDQIWALTPVGGLLLDKHTWPPQRRVPPKNDLVWPFRVWNRIRNKWLKSNAWL